MKSLLTNPWFTALVGAVVGILVRSLIGYITKTKFAIEDAQRRAKLTYLQQQLQEFYWPLQARITQDDAIWELRKASEGMEKEEREKIQEAIENDLLLPNHVEMIRILEEKSHLSGYSEVPEFIEVYLRHVSAFQALRAAGNKEAPSKIGFPWPKEFGTTINEKTIELSKQYASMLDLVLEEKPRKKFLRL